jgi:hypothetical protein
MLTVIILNVTEPSVILPSVETPQTLPDAYPIKTAGLVTYNLTG